MPPEAPTPRLLGESTQPPAVVLSDAGTGAASADDLLGADPAAAGASLFSWARAIALLHDCTAERGDAFRAALAARADQPVAGLATLATEIEQAVTALDEHCARLGVTGPGRRLGRPARTARPAARRPGPCFPPAMPAPTTTWPHRPGGS